MDGLRVAGTDQKGMKLGLTSFVLSLMGFENDLYLNGRN